MKYPIFDIQTFLAKNNQSWQHYKMRFFLGIIQYFYHHTELGNHWRPIVRGDTTIGEHLS